MAFTTVAGGQPIRSAHVNQFSQWITGAREDVSLNLITTHATEYAATVTNENTSAGNVLKLVSGASTIAEFNKTGATFSVPLSATGVLLSSVLTAQADMISASAAGTATRIPKGTAFQSLVMNSGATSQTYASGVLANAVTAGDLFYATGMNAITRVARGTAFQSLVMNSGATAPSWASGPLALATTQGDMFYATGANSLVRLARGTNGHVLTLATGVPVWSASSSNRNQVSMSVGSTSAPTTASTSYATIPDMSVTLTTTGGDLVAWFSGTFSNSSSGSTTFVALALDGGSEASEKLHTTPNANFSSEIGTLYVFTGVSSGSHTVTARWKTDIGNATAGGTRRQLVVMET